jgi:hypothetical protein
LEKATRKRGKRTTFKKLDAASVKNISNDNFNTTINFYSNKIADKSREK